MMKNNNLYTTERIFDELADTGMLGRSMADQYRAEKEELELLRNFVKKHLVIETMDDNNTEWEQVNCYCKDWYDKDDFDFIKEEIKRLEVK